MVTHYEFDLASRILQMRAVGPVDDASLKEFYRVAPKYVEQTQPLAGIFDLTGVTAFSVSPQTIRELASLPPTIPDQSIPRFIVTASPPIFGLARMFELEGQGTRPNLHVVRTLQEVFVILGIQEPKFEPIVLK